MKCFSEVNHPELMVDGRIRFLCDAKMIDFGDTTILKNFFLNEKKPVILVMDLNGLLSNIKI